MAESKLTVIYTAEQIERRVRELGEQISADYAGGEVLLVGILKGAFMFLADLVRHIRIPVRVDFMGISSYKEGKTSSGEVQLTKDLTMTVEGKHVLLVEDIVDTGLSLTYLMNVVGQRKPKSLAIAALLDKPSRRVLPVEVRYRGFEIEDRFVVGYGLDYAELYRNLPDICEVTDGTPAAGKRG